MEIGSVDINPPSGSEEISMRNEDLEIISNWKVINEKLLRSTISTVNIKGISERANLEDVVSLETCVRLEADKDTKREPCSIDIKLKNGQKIARLAIVSEAFLIEIYKQFGEYVSTAHAEFIDEFEQSAVYFADVNLNPPTSEISIKFARLKNPGTAMWLYGIRLSLSQPTACKEKEYFDYSTIADLLQSKAGPVPSGDWAKKMLERSEGPMCQPAPKMSSLIQEFSYVSMDSSKHVRLPCKEESKVEPEKECAEIIGDNMDVHESSMKTYIDERLREMEERLTQRIDTINFKTNEKLDDIIKLLSYKRS